MLVSQLLKVGILAVIRVKHFVDQRDKQLWHLLCDGSKDIIEYRAAVCFFFLRHFLTSDGWKPFFRLLHSILLLGNLLIKEISRIPVCYPNYNNMQ